jgi:hypothetical protein
MWLLAVGMWLLAVGCWPAKLKTKKHSLLKDRVHEKAGFNEPREKEKVKKTKHMIKLFLLFNNLPVSFFAASNPLNPVLTFQASQIPLDGSLRGI